MTLGLVILIVAILIILLNEGPKLFDKELSSKKKVIRGLVIILLILSCVIIAYEEFKSEKYSKDSGVLSGKLDRDIIYPEISFGGGSIIFMNASKDDNFLGIPLAIWIEDNKLKVSTTIRNKDNNIIAKIEGNEWEVITKTQPFFRKNFDDNALEVIDMNEEVIVQIQLDGKAVQLAGIWYKEDGSAIFIKPGPKGLGFIMGGLGPNETVDMNISQIFNYPSELHRGERK